MSSIVLVINTSTFFSSLIHVARFLRNKGLRPVFFFDTDYPTIQTDYKTCESENFDFVVNYDLSPDGGAAQRNKRHRSFIRKGKDYLNFRITSGLRHTGFGKLLTEIDRYRKAEEHFNSVIEQYKVTTIVLVGDLVQYRNALYIKLMHRQNRKAIILPSFMASYKEPCEHYYNNPDHQVSGATLLFLNTFYRKWVKNFRNKNLLRLPVKDILVKEWLSLDPPDPWTIHSGYSDALAVEGEAVKEYGVSLGLPEKKFFVTGSVSQDILHEMMKKVSSDRSKVLSELGITATKPILLSAIPPDMFEQRQAFTQFQSYGEFLRYWVKSVCAQKNFDVILNLHPSMRVEEFRYLEEYGCKIINMPIINLMPLASFFVCCISSTIQWSIALGIPTLNYDVYRYYYDDYNGVDGVVYVQDKEDFEKKILDFDDDDYRETIRQKQLKHSRRWGVIDGKAGERIVSLIMQLSRN